MKLIYAYAMNYRNFKNQAFTLTNSCHVKLLGKSGKWSGIKIEKVDSFCQKMPPNILSISALVGRNATGKTNFVEMIGAKYRLAGHGGKRREDAYFLLYAPNDGESCYYYFEIVSPEKFGTLFSWIKADQITEGRPRCAAGWCRYDGANGRLLAAEQYAPAKGKTVVITLCDRFQKDGMVSNYKFSVERSVRMYRANTFASQVDVVRKLYHNKDRTILRDPEYKLDVVCNMKYLDHGPEGTPHENKPLFPTLYTREEVPEENRDAVRLAENWVKFYAESRAPDFDLWDMMRYTFTQMGKKRGPFDASKPFISEGLFDLKQVFKAFSYCLTEIDSELKENEITTVKSDEFLDVVLTSERLERTECGFTIPVAPVSGPDQEIHKLTRILIDDIFRYHGRAGEFLQPTWVNISDGELWYIHFLASISEALESFESSDNQDTCILLLDEPEIHMHPDLARQLLDHLTQWLQSYMETKVQIILTTHSPFILSDIEKGNVQVLKRSGDDAKTEYWAKVVHPQKQTYAANIYALLTDSFFMDSGFGEMARKQIKMVLQDLGSENTSKEKHDYIKSMIDIVGEELVRRKLEELYRKKYSAYPTMGQEEMES